VTRLSMIIPYRSLLCLSRSLLFSFEGEATRLIMVLPFSKITVVKLKAFTREMASFRKAHAPNDLSGYEDEAFSPGVRETFRYAGFLPYRL
jgi:hypothetical protein